jgi:hypothetical protein
LYRGKHGQDFLILIIFWTAYCVGYWFDVPMAIVSGEGLYVAGCKANGRMMENRRINKENGQ